MSLWISLEVVDNNRLDPKNSKMSESSRKRRRPSRECEKALYREIEDFYDNSGKKRTRNELLHNLLAECRYWRQRHSEGKL